MTKPAPKPPQRAHWMMSNINQGPIEQYIYDLLPERDEVLAEMEAEAAQRKIPIVGPAVGRLFQLLARISGARTIFEMGSAIGYSTIWWARGLGQEGRVIYTDGDPKNAERARRNLERAGVAERVQIRTGDALEIQFTHVPKNEFQVTIAVPREMNLYARMRAGDLTVDDVAGDKDLELTGGDMSIQVPDPADYGPVDLRVRFGDVSGSPFGDPRGWIGNSLRRDGSGKYRLHARVFAGDLMLKP